MRFLCVSVAMLVVVCCVASTTVGAETKNGYDYSFEALEKLHEYHYRAKELNDAELLDGGIDGVRALLREHGIDWQVMGIYRGNTPQSARMQFVAKISDAIARGSTIGVTKEAIAIAAAKALARSLRSSHTILWSEEEACVAARVVAFTGPAWIETRMIERREKKIWYGRLLAFTLGDATIARTMRDAIAREKPDGIVIDLRENAGGSGKTIAELASLFIEDGEEVLAGDCPARKERARVTTDENVRGSDAPTRIPLRILVGGKTYCAAEIFARVMQRLGRARIIGMPTKGSVESRDDVSLSSGPKMSIAITKVWVRGEVLEGYGVRPDLFCRDNQLEAALDELAR